MSLRSRALAAATVLALAGGASVVAVAPAQAAPTAAITDPSLTNCISDEVASDSVLSALLSLVSGLLSAVLGSVHSLDCAGSAITSIAGLQGATTLTSLDLDGNSILDLSALKNLTVPTLSAVGQQVTIAPVTTGVSQAIPVITGINGAVILPTIDATPGLASGIIDPLTGTVVWLSNGIGQLVWSVGNFAGTITTLVTSATQPPYPVATPVISGAPLVGATLATTGDSSTTFQWRRSGAAIAGATTASYVPGVADLGATLSVVATGSADGYRDSSATSAETAAVEVSAPVPTVSGATSVGSRLSGQVGQWSPGVTLAYQWKRSTARSPRSISGATSTTYTATAADVGLTLTLWVTGTAGGNVYVRTSAATAAIGAAPVKNVPTKNVPTKTGNASVISTGGAGSSGAGSTSLKHFASTPRPKIVGRAVVGKKLSVTRGAWSKKVTFTYRWKANGKPIAKATKKTLVVAKKIVGKKITVTLTAHRSGYASLTKTSAASKRVSRR